VRVVGEDEDSVVAAAERGEVEDVASEEDVDDTVTGTTLSPTCLLSRCGLWRGGGGRESTCISPFCASSW
jgi:hypothetical protein